MKEQPSLPRMKPLLKSQGEKQKIRKQVTRQVTAGCLNQWATLLANMVYRDEISRS